MTLKASGPEIVVLVLYHQDSTLSWFSSQLPHGPHFLSRLPWCPLHPDLCMFGVHQDSGLGLLSSPATLTPKETHSVSCFKNHLCAEYSQSCIFTPDISREFQTHAQLHTVSPGIFL